MGQKKTEKLTAGIVSIILLAVLLFSVFYPAVEAHHDCTGEDCHVCACIRLCEQLLQGKETDAGRKAVFLLLSILLSCLTVFCTLVQFFQQTPITEKIRLNN